MVGTKPSVQSPVPPPKQRKKEIHIHQAYWLIPVIPTIPEADIRTIV
jgi:hypothetical protein